MTRRLLLPSLLVALLCACSALTTKWETLNEGGFTARMPGTPKRDTQSVDTPVGKVAFNTYSVENGGEAFIVGYNDFPDNAATQNADAEGLLDKARDGAVRNVNGTVTSEKSVTMNGHPGKEFNGESTTPQPATFTARIYWVSPRLYQVLYIRPKSAAAASENGQKFLDSFQLTGK